LRRSEGVPVVGEQTPSVAPGKLPVIEGFFCKRIPDKKQLLLDIEAVELADAADKDELLTQLGARVMALATIDVHKEAQVHTSSLSGGRRVFEVHVHPQPSFDAFASSMRSARERNVRLLHCGAWPASMWLFLAEMRRCPPSMKKFCLKRLSESSRPS
jgi:hypothetical protein